MKYILVQLFILIITVILLKYLLGLEYFVPINGDDQLKIYNVTVVLVILFFLAQSILGLIVYLTQKFIAYGLREFPNIRIAVMFSFTFSLVFILSILSNILGILDFGYSFILISISMLILYMILSFYGKK